mgnify:CR=1 FL=1
MAATIKEMIGMGILFEVSLAALTILFLDEIQKNGLLRVKGVVILDTGHHLTSHPTGMNINELYI